MSPWDVLAVAPVATTATNAPTTIATSPNVANLRETCFTTSSLLDECLPHACWLTAPGTLLPGNCPVNHAFARP